MLCLTSGWTGLEDAKNTALNFTALFLPEIADNIEELF